MIDEYKYINMTPITSLNDQAIIFHNDMVSQRLNAINNTHTGVLDAIRITRSDIGSCTNMDYNELMLVRTIVDEVSRSSNRDVYRMKRDIQVIRNCNYYYLQINPILVDQDLLRYDEFLTMSYKVLTRDMNTFCSMSEENLGELKKIQEALNKVKQTTFTK